MSLRRRITLAAALAVAAVAIVLGVVGYLSTRSELYGDVRHQLEYLAANRIEHDDHFAGGALPDGGPGAVGGLGPGGRGEYGHGPGRGGAPGYFQKVDPNGAVNIIGGGTVQLPVTPTVLAIAKRAAGEASFDTTVAGEHDQVLVRGDPATHDAVEVSLPLTSDDSILGKLSVIYALLVGAGILGAGAVGALIARSALRPIERFTEQTEQVTSALQTPRRLEEAGAEELRRLAGSFNETLDALERSVQAQRHLIADASHELRTPMAALRSNIQIFLEAERLPEPERLELQESIIAELDELTQLVADVLELARGAAPSDFVEPIELDGVVREAVARAERRAAGLQFVLDIEPLTILNAPDRVSRAVTNVIDNARKWSPPDGTVEVSLRDGVLVVQDHGPGFREGDLEHVFDRFYRSDETRRMPGSGLGLAIVRQAAEAFGGTASAGNAPGGGAILTVRFGSATPPGSRVRSSAPPPVGVSR